MDILKIIRRWKIRLLPKISFRVAQMSIISDSMTPLLPQTKFETIPPKGVRRGVTLRAETMCRINFKLSQQ